MLSTITGDAAALNYTSRRMRAYQILYLARTVFDESGQRRLQTQRQLTETARGKGTEFVAGPVGEQRSGFGDCEFRRHTRALVMRESIGELLVDLESKAEQRARLIGVGVR